MNYRGKRDAAARRDREASRAGRDVGPLPRVRAPRRRAKCERDLRLFCETYRPADFALKWSADHLRVLERLQAVALGGGLFAVAMPRGTGKTTLCETTAIWALLYGHRRFVCVVGADRSAATEFVETVLTELETNDRLLADFPEVCHALRELEGIAHRCRGQTLDGTRTRVTIKADELVLPTVPGAPSSGGRLVAKGITGRIRGMKRGKARPDFVVVDDCQTERSADSVRMTQKRFEIVNGAVLGLAGPGRRIAGVFPCTVIQSGDLADRLLDRRQSPEWQAERCAMLYEWPTRRDLWDRYAELWAEGLEAGAGIGKATAFYRRNRRAMREGARVAWDERHDEDELDGLQSAFNLFLRNEPTFWAEYQNQPIDPHATGDELTLDAEAIARKIAPALKRGTVPTEASKLTGFVDVQGAVLYWAVCAWADDFTGWLVDWGTTPEQGTPYFTLATLRRTLAQAYPGASPTVRVRAGLLELLAHRPADGDKRPPGLGLRTWNRADGVKLALDRLLVDAGWEPSPGTVRRAVRDAKLPRALFSFGRGIRAGDRPMAEWARKPGERTGDGWRIRKHDTGARYVLFDANRWKTAAAHGLTVAVGDPGAFALFDGTARGHRLLGEHLAAEYSTETEGRGRTVREWSLRPGRDNHLLDCVVGCFVGASIEGCAIIPETTRPKRKPRQRVRKLRF